MPDETQPPFAKLQGPTLQALPHDRVVPERPLTEVLGNVNGVTLQYAQGGQGNASATKDGNTYKVTGNATGVDMANPMQQVNKPFEIDATCS
mgnify:CR=1 FL=1